MTPTTLPALLAERARQSPDAAAFRPLVGDRTGLAVTWAQFSQAADSVACALASRGVKSADRIAILARNCIEWEYAQMGALRLGAVVVGIDPNYTNDTLRSVIGTLRPAVVVVEDSAALARIPIEIQVSAKLVVTLRGAAPDNTASLSLGDALGIKSAAAIAMLPAPEGSDLAIVVFSSGTTGLPRPIGYSHLQVICAVEAIVAAFPDVDAGSSLLCWLPLANLFQRILNFCAIARGATVFILGDPRQVMEALPAAAPRLLIGVPRFYERVHHSMMQRAASFRGARGALVRWALGLLRRKANAAPNLTDSLFAPIAEKLVFPSLRRAFGGRLEYLVSGSAPMPDFLLRWYEALGLPIYEAYGVSENIVPVAINRPGSRRVGSVGKPLAMSEVRVADDGEILVRGPGLFAGYLDRPNDSAHAVEDAFWPTGDLGAFDADGYLSITGRKADVFKTPGGRWIAPARIEALLRSIPGIDEAIIVGAGRPCVIAIANVNPDMLALVTEPLLPEHGTADSNALGEGRLRCFGDAVRAATSALPTEERPLALLVNLRPFSIAGGELTSNLKLRRQAIEARLGDAIDDAYNRLDAVRNATFPAGDALPLVVVCR